MKKMIGCALVRVATSSVTDSSNSIIEQKRRLERWIRNQRKSTGPDLEVTHWFEEQASGSSSAIQNRKVLREIFKLLESGVLDFILFEKLDRLSRDPIFNMEFMRLAEKYGCDIYDIESGGKVDIRERGSQLGFFVKNMLDENYSIKSGEKISKAMRERMVSIGKDATTRPTLGLDAHPTKRGLYIINHKEQRVVIDIFNKFVSTGSYSKTVDYKIRCGQLCI